MAAKNAGNSEEVKKEVEQLIAEELPVDVDENPLPAASTTIEEAVKRILPDHYTYGVKDTDLQKPYSKLNNILPEDMHAYSGNENGKFNVELANGIAAGFTNIGMYKTKNEDGIFIDENSQTAMVMDGVGSTRHAETACSVGINVMAQLLNKSRKKGTPPLPIEVIPTKMHKALLKYQQNNGNDYRNSSATMVAARVKEDKKIEFVDAGDSRALLIRKGKVVWQNREDNMKEFLKARYNLKSDEELEDFEADYPNLKLDSLVQCIGMDEFYVDFKNGRTSKDTINPHKHVEQGQTDDIVLLCSDGLTDTIPPEKIAEFIEEKRKKGMPLNEINNKLKKLVFEKWKKYEGKPDNLTILLIEIK